MWGELGLPSLPSALLGPSPSSPSPYFWGDHPLCDADPRGQSRGAMGSRGGGAEQGLGKGLGPSPPLRPAAI